MSPRWLPALLVVLAVLAGAAGFWFGKARRGDVAATTPSVALAGAPWPELRFVDLDLKSTALPIGQGEPVLVNFWATWCAPCLEEIPMLSDLAARRSDLTVIGIAVDDADAVRQFMTNHPMAYDVVLPEVAFDDPSPRVGNTLSALPYSVLIGADGTIRRTKLGAFTPEELARFAAD